MNLGVRMVRKSEECAKTHLRAPGSQKKIPGAMPPGGGERPEGKGRGREGWTPQL